MAGKIVNYETTPMGSFTMNSCWKSEKDGLQKDSDCQTSDELYSFEESATQTSTYHDQETQVSKISQNDSGDGLAVIGEFDEGRNDHSYPSKLKEFLKGILPTILKELDENSASQAFNEYEVSASESSNDAFWWKTLSVDLEKRKVVFPEWSTARHHPGSITNCSVTRNKERLYDIEFDDGSKLSCVREDYIHWLGSADNRNARQNQRSAPSSSAGKNSDNKKDLRSSLASRLQEGVRVHARVVYRNGVEKFVPARIDKVHRGGTYDVECEGGQIEHNMGLDDLMLGLQVGDMVEAKQPNKVHLQCTGLSWNSTGSTLAVAYGKDDILGWCDYPGAVCTWNVFGKQFDSANPDFVLDHNSCMMCVKCHPSLPALIAGGSFNGEIVVWDLSLSEPLYAVSPITEYGHKEPVLDIDWLYDPAAAEWVISSVGADGRVLLWSLSNKLLHPIKGALLTSKKGPTSSSSKRQLSSNHCGTCLAFCGASTGGTGAGLGGVSSALPKWYLVGEQGGGIVRGQIVRTLGSGNRLTNDSFKNLTSVLDIYPPVRNRDEAFFHESHIGSVNALSCSPFARNIFLSAGSDGYVKLFHMFETLPLRQWTPEPSPDTPGSRAAISSITGMQFSPTRPGVFAATSADGFLYIYDMSSTDSTPIIVLEAPPPALALGDQSEQAHALAAEQRRNKNTQSHAHAQGGKRAAFSGIAFNRKQRDLIAACDTAGRVNIWRLSWGLSHPTKGEFEYLKAVNDNVTANSTTQD